MTREVNPAGTVDPNAAQRVGVVAVVGRTNVGKSTLINRLVGEKVSIVSDMVQTTRNRVRAILTEPRGQLVLIDTPGVHKAHDQLGTLMNKMARGTVSGCDVVMLVLDTAARPYREDEGWFSRMLSDERPWVCVLNKMDDGSYARAYRDMWERLSSERDVQKPVVWLEISAATGAGCELLTSTLFDAVPEGPLLFPEDVLTDFPEKLAVADVIREKLVAELRDEVPHAVAVRVEHIDKEDDQWVIGATIFVDRSSQKGIVIGQKGRRLRKVRRQATAELEDLHGVSITLETWVKVEKNWKENFWMLKQLGYAD